MLIAFVEVQEGIEFRLAGKQLLQPRLMLKWAIHLGLVVCQFFLDASHAILLLNREFV